MVARRRRRRKEARVDDDHRAHRSLSYDLISCSETSPGCSREENLGDPPKRTRPLTQRSSLLVTPFMQIYGA